jgi:Holliday junction DNA helicase RuvA
LIDYVRGKLISAAVGNAIVEVNGIGIGILTPPSENIAAMKPGEIVTLYTRLLIREDEIHLYGFKTAEERKLFNLTLGVSGFGPRLALSLLGLFSVSQLYMAILEENIPQLCRAHGIGKKAAQRLILELKEKLPGVLSPEELATGAVSKSGSSLLDEVTEALCSLGYSPAEAIKAAGKAYEKTKEATREELLKDALKSMAGN